MSLRLQEQCLRSTIKSVVRVAHVLLLRPISGNMDVNTLASKHSELLGNAAIVRKRRVIHKVDQCAFASSSCGDLHGNAGTQGRPVAGFRQVRERERYGDRKTNIERERRVQEHETLKGKCKQQREKGVRTNREKECIRRESG